MDDTNNDVYEKVVEIASQETGLEKYETENEGAFLPFSWFRFKGEVLLDGNFTLKHLELIVATFKKINELYEKEKG